MYALALAAALSTALPAPTLCPGRACQLRLEGMEDAVPSRRDLNVRITAAVLVAAVVVVVAWDVAVALRGGPTESQVIADLSLRWTILPLAVGIIAGHWFWHAEYENRPRLMGLVAAASLFWDLTLFFRGPMSDIEVGLRNPAAILLVGVVVGHFLWSQNR